MSAADLSASDGSHDGRLGGPRRAYDSPMADVTTHDDGPVRVITLSRPEARNALSRTLRDELRAEVAAAEADEAVRAVVLTGAGEAFCAGLDLRELEATVALSPAEHREDTQQLAELLTAIVRCRKPVIAAVNGPAVAGGAGRWARSTRASCSGARTSSTRGPRPRSASSTASWTTARSSTPPSRWRGAWRATPRAPWPRRRASWRASPASGTTRAWRRPSR